MMTTLSVVPEYVQGAPSYMYTDTTVPFDGPFEQRGPLQNISYIVRPLNTHSAEQ